ncbi:hypothetical protein BW730_05135 [Tessaracoccus aquimaris]|uniref:DUF3710 domain-containing protein n=1 Tax=Tessaracoccus aquimaris TaxID=1332264 RepID=A0A1Q2CSY0_9ACTN|nr:hypothetical protein BW730_05135 [Tessaracoccus aquimaris]
MFGRKKQNAKEEAVETVEVAEEASVDEEAPKAEEAPELSEPEAQARAWDDEFDREEGPFDIAEVDLEADEDDVTRLDLGSIIVTPFEGMTIQLQVNRDTNVVQSILVGDGESGLEVAAFAGPTKSSMIPEIREEIIKATAQQQGQIAVSQGPFGSELRRALPVKDPNGNAATHLSRTWMVSGPGWLLRGVLLGKATFEPENEDAQVALFEFFSNIVVRRGTAPVAPGSLLPMKVPEAEG